jgi:PTH1 family peptidyl-tRNA hydrolase
MNASGEAVQSLASYYKVDIADILVVQDEMDLAPGALSFIAKGGAAGHNGIASIQDILGHDDITRLRIGVGRPTPPIAKEDHVLGNMDDLTKETLPRAAEAITDWITKGTTHAMNTWNRK